MHIHYNPLVVHYIRRLVFHVDFLSLDYLT
jgi:hypothetical protein